MVYHMTVQRIFHIQHCHQIERRFVHYTFKSRIFSMYTYSPTLEHYFMNETVVKDHICCCSYQLFQFEHILVKVK